MWAFGGGRVYLYDLADALSQAPTVTPRLQIAGNIGEIFGAGLYTPTAADLADLVRRAESAELDSESLGRRPLLGVYSVFAAGYGDSYIRRSLHDAVTGEVVLIESDASALDRGAALLGADLNGDGVVDAGDLAAFWRYGDSRAPPRRRAAARCGRI
ncbi:MAG: hypothetical protein EA376_03650 [Phycisphaeraceae bacterium]|nr:MAG: hypothetical protein EA376_03650 [Phycisphaeraceae bacterium]